MVQWLSSYVKEQPEVREALSDLAKKSTNIKMQQNQLLVERREKVFGVQN